MTLTNKKAIEILNALAWVQGGPDREETITAISMAIEALADRPTGEWVWSDEDASWKCGRCDCVFEEIDWKPNYNFCPNCGARMKGGAE